MRVAKHRFAMVTLATAACALVASGASARSGGQGQLIPANWSAKTDALGFRWDINQSGQVNDGLSDCFDGGMRLTVNGQQFNATQPQMTSDGKEFVLSAKIQGLMVTRRIKVNSTASATRYVEVIKNNGRASVSVTVAIMSNLGGSCQTVLTSSGTPSTNVLGPKDTGMVAVQQFGQSRPSVVWNLSGTTSRVKPSISVQNRRMFLFTFPLTIPAGKTAAIVHTVAQRRFPGTPDPKALAALFKKFGSRAWTKDIPREIRRSIVNHGRAGLGAGGIPSLAKALGGMDLARGGTDILAFGDDTRLAGSASCDSLRMTTRYGSITVPFEDVAAVMGKRRTGRARIYTRDGRIYAGKLEAAGLTFAMNSGPVLKLTVEGLDVLLTREDPADGMPREGASAAIDTFDGNRLTIIPSRDGGDPPALTLVTPWGERRVTLDEIRWVRPAEDSAPGHVVSLKDGSRFFGFLAGEKIKLETVEFGAQVFEVGEIRAIENLEETRRRRRAEGRALRGLPGALASDEDELTEPHVILTGGNVIVGYIDLGEVHVIAQGALIPLPPNQLRSLHNLSEENSDVSQDDPGSRAMFRAELWAGGVVVGSLREAELPIRSGEWVMRVPVADVVDVFVPTPAVPDALRDRIAKRIRNLGHPEWKEREKASRALEDFGYVARLQLKEAFKESSDPEVKRRAKALLDKTKD
jgi:hypothetical protein